MHAELADHIALLAAPIYAAMLAPFIADGHPVGAGKLGELREAALDHALALRLDALEMPAS